MTGEEDIAKAYGQGAGNPKENKGGQMSYEINLSTLTNMASKIDDGRWHGDPQQDQLIILVALLERLESIAASLDSR